MLDEFNVPQPDLIWVAERSRNIISPARIEGPPELVVEVLSPTSYKRDRDVRFKLYERSGVQEYWLVSPPQRSIMVWSLNDGRYQLVAVFDADEMLVSPLLGELPLRDLFSAQP
jgi:Uma2 family endonuclease